MATEPMMTWERIVTEAHKLTGGGTADIDPVDAYMFATAVLYFDRAIKDGGTKLPASWQSAAVHAAGYERAPR
jgi:hypothetical protein